MRKRFSGRMGMLALLGLGLAVGVPAYAFNMGDFMNPGRWVGGSNDRDRDRGYEQPYGPPGYFQGSPYGQPPYGQMPYGQMPYGQGSPPPGQAPFGQMPFGQTPQGQMPYGQMPYSQTPYGQPPFGDPQQSREGWPYGYGGPPLGITPDHPGGSGFGMPPGGFYSEPAFDDRSQQRIRELEMRLEELERRHREDRDRGRPPALVYPPLGH